MNEQTSALYLTAAEAHGTGLSFVMLALVKSVTLITLRLEILW
jgi:hypothetical protein